MLKIKALLAKILKRTIIDFGIIGGDKSGLTLAAYSYTQIDINLSSQLAGYNNRVINYTNCASVYVVCTNAWLDTSGVLHIVYYNPTSAQRSFTAQYSVMRWKTAG